MTTHKCTSSFSMLLKPLTKKVYSMEKPSIFTKFQEKD